LFGQLTAGSTTKHAIIWTLCLLQIQSSTPTTVTAKITKIGGGELNYDILLALL
jgi:hypothetical protein